MESDGSVVSKRSDDEPATATLDKLMTFHCARCNTVLCDSVGVCGEIRCLDSVACLSVTKDVVIIDASEVVHKGQLDNCVYNRLKCHECCCTVGKVLISTPPHLAAVRSLFLLRKTNLNCYIINSGSMVKASTLTFDLKPLSECMKEVRQMFEAHLDQLLYIKDKLANRTVTSELCK